MSPTATQIDDGSGEAPEGRRSRHYRVGRRLRGGPAAPEAPLALLGFASGLALILLGGHGKSGPHWGDVSAAYLAGIVGMVLVYSIRHAPRGVGSAYIPSEGSWTLRSLVCLAVAAWLGLRKVDWAAWPAVIGA